MHKHVRYPFSLRFFLVFSFQVVYIWIRIRQEFFVTACDWWSERVSNIEWGEKRNCSRNFRYLDTASFMHLIMNQTWNHFFPLQKYRYSWKVTVHFERFEPRQRERKEAGDGGAIEKLRGFLKKPDNGRKVENTDTSSSPPPSNGEFRHNNTKRSSILSFR